MRGLNVSWAITELSGFIDQSKVTLRPGSTPLSGQQITAGTNDEITKAAQVVEQILDQVIPAWRVLEVNTTVGRWERHRSAALRAKEALEREQELRENLGENAPLISAANLHPWVWSGAKSLWQSGHYRSAVEDALKKVNAETQNKVGRRDLNETKLFQESFSEISPQPGKPRLRRMASDDSDTYKSLQRGARTLAEGIYAGIRNPLNHEAPQDMDQQVALEYLAAISVLARWVDEAHVEYSK